jgi:hypothetical protein
MKKLMVLMIVSFLCNVSTNSAKPTQSKQVEQKKSALKADPTPAEQAAYERVVNKLLQRYEDLGVHDLIAEALQEVADENRDDFEVVLKFSGVENPMEPGTIIVPFGPVFFGIR